jgi:hypothetical protein
MPFVVFVYMAHIDDIFPTLLCPLFGNARAGRSDAALAQGQRKSPAGPGFGSVDRL